MVFIGTEMCPNALYLANTFLLNFFYPLPCSDNRSYHTGGIYYLDHGQ